MITTFKGSRLHYIKVGHGPTPLLLFHGFGQNHEAFRAFAEETADTYTCYLFDLYFHGQSHWANDDMPLEKSAWKHVMTHFLQENHIERFSIGGFSLGGKLALATLEAFPSRIVDLYLVAPDGIKTSFWYSLATYPYPLRRLFKSMIKHPSRFFTLASAFHKVGLLDKGLMRFASSQMATTEQRQRVYASWTIFRRLIFDMRSIAGWIKKYQINTVIIVGEHDKVIRAKNMRRLTKHLTSDVLVVLPTGHNGLLKGDLLKRALNQFLT